MFKKFGILLVLLMVLLPTLPLYAQQDAPSFCVSVWLSSLGDPTGLESIRTHQDVINEVNFFWYNPAPDGTLLLSDVAEDAELIAEMRAANIKIIPSVVSFGFSAMIEDPAMREVHIQAIVDTVERMDYDGIDIDYESFLLHTRDDFSEFIEALADALHANGRLLSVTVHPKTADVSQWDSATAQDWVRLAAAADMFKIMVYDYHNQPGDPGAIAPTPWADEVLAYAASVTDISKVRLGLPFYGLTWQRRNRPTASTWESIQRTVESFDLEFTRDPADMEARLDFDAPTLPAQVTYMADAVSLEFKLAMVQANYPDLGGVSIWGIGGEDPANWDVLGNMPGECTFFK